MDKEARVKTILKGMLAHYEDCGVDCPVCKLCDEKANQITRVMLPKDKPPLEPLPRFDDVFYQGANNMDKPQDIPPLLSNEYQYKAQRDADLEL